MKNFTSAFKLTARYAFMGLLSLSLFSSCKKDDPYNFEETLHSRVNLINASPDAPAARLYVDDVLRTPNGVNFGEASGYYDTFSGTQDVIIKSASGEATLATTNAGFDVETSYTYMLIGQNSALSILAVNDDLAAPASGKAKIRYVNASPNSSGVTLNNGSTVLVGAQNYRGVAPTVEVNAGNYTLRAYNTGAFPSAAATVNLESGKIYTVYAKGLVGGTGNSAFSVGVFTNK
ncbi:DUF4397 domain-containing protein [Mucilaginibacter aquatilis]|uniref:DUF4397 domain-containing protein n=1 Tax=Mucilaginibacter aquatilis TaxID=1517760 RepID=A0A6I4I703_9SPHI|nr:DUF4397 domain-containing protein [Mucilaginibacter aquatilis]MVN90862.1 DUF4397 domain-containing protein [Mucilaginibacter aquatilis]